MSHTSPSIATSTAPVIGRKRQNDPRESESEDRPTPKRTRTEDSEDVLSSASQMEESASKDTEDVTEVTKGVEEVEIKDKEETPAEAEASTVPLPDSPRLEAQKEADEPKDMPEDASGKVLVAEGAEPEAGKESEELVEEAPKVDDDEVHHEKDTTPSDVGPETETSTVVDEKDVIEPKSVLPPVEEIIPAVATGVITAA